MTEQTQFTLLWIVSILGLFCSIIYTIVILRNQATTAPKKMLAVWGILVAIWFCFLPSVILALPVTQLESIKMFFPVYGTLVLTSSYLIVTRSLIKFQPLKVNPVILSIIIISASVYIISIQASSDQNISFERLNQYLLVTFWLAIILVTGHDLIQILKNSQRPLHRNRIIFWSLTYIFELLIGISIFTGMIAISGILRSLQLGLVAYVVLTHPLPDIQITLRKTLRYFIVSISILFLFLFFLISFEVISSTFIYWNPVVLAGGFLMVLALITKPIVFWLIKITTQILPDQLADLQNSMRQYNQKISKLMDLHDFAHHLLQHIDETIEINHGFLFNVEKETTAASLKVRLKGYAEVGDIPQKEIIVDRDDPVFKALYSNHQTVTQYEIDFLPNFADTSPQLIRQLDELEIEIFVPIISRQECIGIIALGTKASGTPYSKDEIQFLQALSDQSAIALENARLLNGLARLNNEYRRAYTALEKSNQSLEKAVRQLEKLDRVKSDFLTILSHELRTPMTLISGYTQLLLDEPEIQNDPELSPLIQGINDGTQRLEDIIQSMLDMSAIDARSMEVHIQPVNIDELLSRIHHSLADVLRTREQNLTVEKITNIPIIETDPNLLEKALYQLLSNAIKYTPDTATIRINLRQLAAGESPIGEPSIEFEVIDQGIGIDQEQIELIFNKFYQTQDVLLHSSGKTKYKGGGPGLGLAIVKGIITDLHGRVWAKSYGQNEENPPGSSFYIVLPIKREPTGKTLPKDFATFPINSP